jgi:hypothetical protein
LASVESVFSTPIYNNVNYVLYNRDIVYPNLVKICFEMQARLIHKKVYMCSLVNSSHCNGANELGWQVRWIDANIMRICFTTPAFVGKGTRMRETCRWEAAGLTRAQAQFSTSSLGASMHRCTWLLWLLREYVHLAVLTSPVLYVDWFCVESCMPSECVPRRPVARHLSWHVYLACIGGWNGSGKKVRPTLVMATTGIRSTWGRRSMCDSPRGCHVYIHVEDSTYV